MTFNEERLNKLFEELVPLSGKADNLAGEIVRATTRLDYRFFNDGDMIGKGYGNETCNPAARFLEQNTEPGLALAVKMLWDSPNDKFYEDILDTLIGMVVDYLAANPDLRNKPTDDMFNYAIPADTEYRDEFDEEDEDYDS